MYNAADIFLIKGMLQNFRKAELPHFKLSVWHGSESAMQLSLINPTCPICTNKHKFILHSSAETKNRFLGNKNCISYKELA